MIIKNMFDPKEFDQDPTLVIDYQSDVKEECNKTCGLVKKVIIYDRNPEGVLAVFFDDFESADKCVQLMNGRWFAGRQLNASNWDGRTRYKIEESEEDAKKRIDEWNKFLEE